MFGGEDEREGGERARARASPTPVGPRVWRVGQPPRVGNGSWDLVESHTPSP